MAEDTCVFLVSGRIRGDFSQLQMIFGVGGLQDHHAIFGIQFFFYGVERLFGKPLLHADAGKRTEAVGLNINLSLVAFFGSDLFAVGVVGAHKPVAVPAVLKYSVIHFLHFRTGVIRFRLISDKLA